MQFFWRSLLGKTKQSDKPRRSDSVSQTLRERVRDHLANERTYLAWMRSAVSLMGFGVLIVRLRTLRPPLAPQPPGNGWKLGLAFALVGLVMVVLT